MKRWPRIVAALIVIAALLAGAYVAKQILWSGAATTRTQTHAVEARIVELINQRRAANGLPALRVDADLTAIALGHTQEMFQQSFFAHNTPHGHSFEQRVQRLHRSRTGENIAWGTGGYGNPAGIVSLWMTSPGHRKIILDPHLHRVGVGVVIGSFEGQHDARLVTADFSS